MINLFKEKKERYDYRDIFKKLMVQLESFDLAQDNIEEILKTILAVVGANSGSVYLYQEDKKLFMLKKYINERPLNVSVAENFELIEFLTKIQNVVFKDEIVSDTRYRDIQSAGVHYFTHLCCAAVVPLYVKNKWIGLLNIGRSSLTKKYEEEDRTILMLMGYWFAHHISNTYLFKEIRGQNTKLAEMTELKNQLMANVSHELRTPLNGIIGLTELLIDGSDGEINEDQSRHLGMIKASADSLLEIIDNMLSLIKVEAHKKDVQVTRVHLNALVKEVSELFEGVIVNKKNQFQITIPPHTSVYGDTDQLRTVLMNLLGNAFKFTENGFVEVGAERSGEMIKVAVKDSGIGIPKDEQKKIFEEFRQVNGSMTRLYGGTGLGLAIAKKIVELHGGRIWVESMPDQGSEFYFTLPMTPTGIQAMEVG